MGILITLLRSTLVLVIAAALAVYVVAGLRDQWQQGGDPETHRQVQGLLALELQGSAYELVDFRLSERTREDSYHILGEVRWRGEPGRRAPFVGVLVQLCQAESAGFECWDLRRFEVISDFAHVARVPIVDETSLPDTPKPSADGLGVPLASGPVGVRGSWQGEAGETETTFAFAPERRADATKPSGRSARAGVFDPRADDNGHMIEDVPPEMRQEPRPSTAALASAPPEWRVSASRVNVRAGPGVSHEVLTTLTEGTRLRLEEQRLSWGRFSWQVEADARRQGWIYLELVAPPAEG